MMNHLENKFNLSLRQKEGTNPFGIFPDTKLEKPFKKNDVVKAEIKLSGRQPFEKIAVARNRLILIRGCQKEKGFVKVKIVRDKHNIYLGTII